jgi:hypothetical protein
MTETLEQKIKELGLQRLADVDINEHFSDHPDIVHFKKSIKKNNWKYVRGVFLYSDKYLLEHSISYLKAAYLVASSPAFSKFIIKSGFGGYALPYEKGLLPEMTSEIEEAEHYSRVEVMRVFEGIENFGVEVELIPIMAALPPLMRPKLSPPKLLPPL